nr:MAG TPA: hypothetical protein [Bacteriophage sp.]
MDEKRVIGFEVGKPFHGLDKHPEGAVFEMTEGGPILFCNYIAPTQAEIEAFQAGKRAEFRLVRLGGILFVLSRFGSLPWVDSPFTIQLSRAAAIPEIPEGSGYGLTIVLLDKATSIVKSLRLIGLSTDFSRALRDEVLSDASKPLDIVEYYASVNEVMRRYSTKDMVKMSSVRCVVD